MLSIIIPTRNRQSYIKSAVRAALERKGSDIEVVIADNSDDGNIIYNVLEEFTKDNRLIILKSPHKTLSMRENWERGLSAGKGDWISFIGDDDLLDPSLQEFLIVLEKNSPHTEVLTWEKANYVWPDLVSETSKICSFPIGDECKNLVGFKVLEILYQWNHTRNPGSGPSIYHGAYKKEYINKIKKIRNGIFFKYETVDFDAGYTALLLASGIAISKRSFSILGSSAPSNSGAMNQYKKHKERMQQWSRETPRGLDGINLCPIDVSISISTVVFAFQVAFAQDHKLNFQIDPKAIINAINIDLAYEPERREFEEKRKRIYDELLNSDWKIYVDLFKPKFMSRQTINPLRGIYRNRLYIPHGINGSKNIYDFYKNTFWILFNPELVGRDFSIHVE
jgi:glycosyltransferase involved in cell wall biosynthesis